MNHGTPLEGSCRLLDKALTTSVFSWQEIVRMTIPFILDSLSITLMGTLITALISKNGESSIAAVSLINPIANLIICLFNGIGAGGTVVVARCMGARDRSRTQSAVGMILWLTIVVGVLTCVPFLCFPEPVLKLLYPTAAPEVMEKAVVFFVGNVWSIVFFSIYTAAFSILRGMGESKKCLVLTIIINGAYLLFSILFLNVLNLDIRGSVMALLLARILGALCAVLTLLFWKPIVPMVPKALLRFQKSLLRDTLHISVPFALEQIFVSLGGVVSQTFMIHLGTTALAVHAVANSVLSLVTCASGAAANLSVTTVGRCIGAGCHDGAMLYGKRSNQIARLLVVLSALIVYPLLGLILRMYNPTQEAEEIVRQLLLISLPALILFFPASNTMPGTMRAAGDTIFPSIATLIISWVVNIGLGYVMAISLGLGLWGIWIATWGSWAVRWAVFTLRFRQKGILLCSN